MTNNSRTTPTSNYHSQQDMRKLANGKNSNITSLPRHTSNCKQQQQQQQQQESCLTNNHIYSQPIVPNGVGAYINTTPKFNTTERHIRLTQDHFNHNKYPKLYSQTLDGDYLHNNSHYSLPIDHSIQNVDDPNASPSQSPTPPTPPPPALPLRNGSCNTTGRRSNGNATNNNNNSSLTAAIHKNNTLNLNNNNNINNNINNHTGSLRHQYH